MKKISTLTFALLLAPILAFGQNITIDQAAGWIETAFAKWQPIATAESYNVYLNGEGIVDKKLDDPLIRNYGTYLRADAIGLKAGTYTLRIVPVKEGTEIEGTTTQPLTVIPHDRSGYAFANNRIPGAYNADGTPKANAVILYITENTKNKIALNVAGASTNPCIGLQPILDGYKKGKETRPLIVRFIGQIKDLATMYNGDIVVENNQTTSSYITLEGVGDDATLDGWGIRIKNATNVETRNLGTMNCNSSEGDNISLQQDNSYIWVHHCDFFYGEAGGDADQNKGDGALDCKKSTYITFSYNHFWDSGKCNLLGLSEKTNDGLFITYHHNWYDHSDSRHPRVRYFSAHIYNNYYDGNSKYGVGATMGSSLYVEKNVFRNCSKPIMISMQGTDTKNGTDEKNAPTFSGEDGGMIKAFDNTMTGNYTFAPYSPTNTIHFDAYIATTRDEQVAASITTKKGTNSYNNFDTNLSKFYPYTPHPTENVVEDVTRYAGRTQGGDLKWTFNNATDDTSYAIIPGLKTAVSSYKTKLISIQGETNTPGGDDDDNEPGGEEEETPSEGDQIHNFTISDKTSTFYTITGNTSTSYGKVSYNDIELTKCLKMESSTSITFSTPSTAELTLVFPLEFNGEVTIDGQNRKATNGIVILNLAAETHSIKKKDAAYLFYICTTLNTETSIESIKRPTTIAYPNPASDYLYLNTPETATAVELHNANGQLVRTLNPAISNKIPLNDLPKGIYLLHTKTTETRLIQKIIKR